MNEREILIRLCKSLCVCEHMGEVHECIEKAMKLIGVEVNADNEDLAEQIPGNKGIWD